MNNIPNEILLNVFTYLTKKDLFQCLQVNKLWFIMSGRYYYHTIHINSNLHQAKDFIYNLGVGHLIKKLTLKPNKKTKELEFYTLMVLCPNLLELSMNDFWKYMLNANPAHFKPLKLTSSCQNEDFYKSTIRYSQSLIELEINKSCDEVIYKQFGNLFNYLNHFENLKSLVIKNGSRKHIICFEELLKTCRNLKHISFQLDHPLYEQQHVDHYPSLMQLDLFLLNFSMDAINYIQFKFINLQNLTLRINQQNDQPISIDFFKNKFLTFIDRLYYSNLIFQINGPSSMEDLLLMYYLENVYKANFVIHHGRSERTQINLLKKNKRLVVNYVFVRDLLNTSLPIAAYLEKFGSTLIDLNIEFSTQFGYEQTCEFINLCSNLKRLNLHINLLPTVYMNDYHYPTAIISNQQLESLSLTGMTIANLCLDCIKEISFINCLFSQQYYDYTTYTLLDFFLLDLAAYRYQHTQVCIVITNQNTPCYYLTNPTISTLQSISDIEYSQLNNIHTIQFKFNHLKSFCLCIGRMSNISKTF